MAHNTNKINYLNNANKYVTPEEFTGSDDEKILQCINEAVSTNKTALFQNNYVLENPVYIDGVGKCLNIEVTGSIKPLTGGLYLENLTDGDINIKIIGGGDENLSSYGVRLLNCNGIKVNIKGKNYRGTLVKMGGDATNSTKVSRTQASVDSWGCLRCLEHGDNTEEGYQNAFGEYEYIQDFYSDYGILFQRAYDVTINHLENMVDDTTNTINSLEFNACGSIHCNTIAVGGRCGNLLNVIDSTVCINELFVIGEDGSTNPVTNGLRIEGVDSKVLINILTAKSVKKIVNVVNKDNNTIVNIGNIVRKSTNTTEILVEVDGFVYATPTYNTGFILNYGFVNYGNLHLHHNGTSGAMLHFKRYNTTSTAFRMGVENNTNNEFVLRSSTSDASIKYPLLARDNGDIFIGADTQSLGFYGVNKKTTQQTILDAATDLDSCIALVNNIRSILINLNLVKSK